MHTISSMCYVFTWSQLSVLRAKLAVKDDVQGTLANYVRILQFYMHTNLRRHLSIHEQSLHYAEFWNRSSGPSNLQRDGRVSNVL